MSFEVTVTKRGGVKTVVFVYPVVLEGELAGQSPLRWVESKVQEECRIEGGSLCETLDFHGNTYETIVENLRPNASYTFINFVEKVGAASDAKHEGLVQTPQRTKPTLARCAGKLT